MPVSETTVRRLADLVTPGIHLLVGQLPSFLGFPPAPGKDVVEVRAWLAGLDDGLMRAFVAVLPVSDLTAQVLREVDGAAPAPPAPPPAPVAPVVPAPAPAVSASPAIPPEPLLATLTGKPNVDRQPIWDGLRALLDSERRVLLVNGESKQGKSRARELTKLFVSQAGLDRHVAIDADLDSQTFDELIELLFESFLGAEVPKRAAANSADEAYLKRVATSLHMRARKLEQTAWFVFDHVERLLDFGIHMAFFNQLAQLAVEDRHQPRSPRLVLIDRREAPGVHKNFKWPVSIAPLTAEDVATFLQRHDPSLARNEALAGAAEVMERARKAAEAEERPARYMDLLAEELAEELA